MRFFEIVLSGAALIAAAAAQLQINDYPQAGVEAGKTYTITYSPKDQTPTTVILRRGSAGNLDTVATLGTATGGSFTWTVPSNLPNAETYAIEIQQGTVVNYSGQFPLKGGSGSLSSAIASASAAVSSAFASASSKAAASSSAAASSAAASASSAVASLISQASSIAASATILPSAGANSTISSATLSRTAAASVSRTASATTANVPQSTGAASTLDTTSPLALIFGAIAAIAYLH